MAELNSILNLIQETAPSCYDSSLMSIIELNQGKLRNLMESHLEEATKLSEGEIDQLLRDEESWEVMTDENQKRTNFLRFLLQFRSPQHIEMLDLTSFRNIIRPEVLKKVMTKTLFVNYSINEKTSNRLLTIQGYFIKSFIYFHMRHDMRFKATIDSQQIQMDNPYTRNTIREENRKDPELETKYIKNIKVESFCIQLLREFYSDILGIWADHTHNAPSDVLQFIKLCYEFGFISPEMSREILKELVNTSACLIKLEEGWIEKLRDVTRLSDMIKASNVASLFANCREHLALILVQILVLETDTQFIQEFPKLIHYKQEKGASDSGKDSKSKYQRELEKFFDENFVMYDKEFNDSIITITMNYLSNTIFLGSQKSMSDTSRLAVEKIFLFLTTTTRDSFLNSLKQISSGDLKYFEKNDIISRNTREVCDDLGNSMRTLLKMIGLGLFDKFTGGLNKEYPKDDDFNKYLKQFVPLDNPTLQTIIKRLLVFIDENIAADEDFKVAFVKESIPLALISMADYVSQYYEKPVRAINREIFNKLGSLCQGNNYCKAQLFKGDALHHLMQMMRRQDKDTYLFISLLCQEENVTFFMGRHVFGEFLKLYEEFNNKICESLDLTNGENLTNNLQIESCTIFLIMTRIITKIFKKPFLNEREMLQAALSAQEVIYPDLYGKLMMCLLFLLRNEDLEEKITKETKNLYKEDQEPLLVRRLEEEQMEDEDTKKILVLNLCFSVLKAFNLVSSNSSSNKVQMMFKERYSEPIQEYMAERMIQGTSKLDPFGLDTELCNFLSIIEGFSEQKCILENRIETNGIKLDFKSQLDFTIQCIQRLDYLMSDTKKLSQAKNFAFECIFPLVFNLASSVKNLTDYNNPSNIEVTRGFTIINGLMDAISLKISKFNTLVGKTLAFEEGFPGKQFTGFQNKSNTELFSGTPNPKKRTSQKKISFTGDQNKKKESNQDDNSNSKTSLMMKTCDNILMLVEVYYMESDPVYQDIYYRMKDMTKETFEKRESAAKFEISLNKKTSNETGKNNQLSENELNRLNSKVTVLNDYIKLYQNKKEDYFVRAEEPNLMSFFDRNSQNLKGVFNSCLDRLMNRTKQERFAKDGKELSTEYSITRFWLNSAGYAYINMMVRLLTQSKIARKELHFFLEEEMRCIQSQDPTYDCSKQEKDSNARQLVNMRRYTNGRNRSTLLSILIRILADLTMFLTRSPSQNQQWWVIHQTYEMISMFFKNLCECNFMEFKQYLGEFKPYVHEEDEGWKNMRELTAMQIFVKLLGYINSISRIAKNKDPEMVDTDFFSRVFPLMVPMTNLINEAITGPCAENQKSIHESHIDFLINISMRVVDNINSDYIELAESSINLLMSMLEGYDESIIKLMASRVPPSVLEDRLTRFTKKIFIKELIDSDKFTRYAMKTQTIRMQRERERTNSLLGGLASENQPKSIAIEGPKLEEYSNMVKEYKEKEENDGDCMINEDMENSVEIQDWEELYSLYMKREALSESRQFHFIFKIIILWQTMAKGSKTHKARFIDAKDEAEIYFEDVNLFAEATPESIARAEIRSKSSPSELSCIIYFLAHKIMIEIEIVDPSKNAILIYFPKAPQTFMLSDEAKVTYRETADITDSNTKMLNLMRNFNMFYILMSSDLKTWRLLGFAFKFLSEDAFTKYTYFCWFVGVLLNIVMSAGLKIDDDQLGLIYKDDSYFLICRIWAYSLAAISGLFLTVWIVFKYKEVYKTRLEDYLFEHKNASRYSPKTQFIVAVDKAFMQQPYPMNYTLHILFSILGVEISPFFMSFNLLLIINISTTCKFVLTSIILHVDQLVLTLVLAIFIIFSYSFFLGNLLYNQIDPEVESPCNTLVECFFFTFNLGLRNGGGVSDSLVQVERENMMVERTIFDITFFLLINIISLNIVFGIIIDTFSQLRDSQNQRINDTRNNCYVCGNTRLDFSQAGINFDHHIEVQHDPWKYLFYIIFLKNKGESELNGLEYFVWTQFCNNKTNWMPIGNTSYIVSEKAEQLKALDGKMKNLDTLVEDILGNIKGVSEGARETLQRTGYYNSLGGSPANRRQSKY